MKVSKEKLLADASATGFRPEILEKVIQLLHLLEALYTHPFLTRERLALKGGTALNLFILDVPRLSVDIDLNYIGAADRDTMLAERPKVDQAIDAVCRREGFAVRRAARDEHAGGKWSLRYESSVGEGGNLELDINFLLRVPLWPIANQDSRQVGSYQARKIPVVDLHELAAGKLAALLSRRAVRDLYDAHRLLTLELPDRDKLRLAFVVYGGVNRKDWRTVSAKDVAFDASELEQQLLPLLRTAEAGQLVSSDKWGEKLVAEGRQRLDAVLPFSAREREFLDKLMDHGEIDPSLLTDDGELRERIRQHPGLQWKALNVRQFKLKK